VSHRLPPQATKALTISPAIGSGLPITAGHACRATVPYKPYRAPQHSLGIERLADAGHEAQGTELVAAQGFSPELHHHANRGRRGVPDADPLGREDAVPGLRIEVGLDDEIGDAVRQRRDDAVAGAGDPARIALDFKGTALKAKSVVSPLFSAFGPEPIATRLQLGDACLLVTTEALYRRKITALRERLPTLRHVVLIDEGDFPPGTLRWRDLMSAAAPASPFPRRRPKTWRCFTSPAVRPAAQRAQSTFTRPS
jgi:hypothetical protein